MLASKQTFCRSALRVLFAALLGFVLESGLHAQPSPPPYEKLRDTVGGYNGPSEDFQNLTEIRIGWFGPSDPADPINGDFWWAADFAVKEANAHRDLANPTAFTGLPIRLVPRWAPDPWRAGVSLLTRMVYDEPPLALIGSIDSASTHLAEQVVSKANLPLVSPIATDKTATLAGVSWMFSCVPDDSAIASALVSDIPGVDTKSTSKPSIVLIATTDHASRMSAREVTRELARRGITPEFRFDLSPGAANAKEALQGAGTSHPNAIIVIGDPADSARITVATRAQLHSVPVFGTQTMGHHRFLELAGPAAENVRLPVLFAPAENDAATLHFTQQFTAARGHAPDYTAALAYDATRMLIEAILHAGPNRARVREEVVHASPWTGIAGQIAFDRSGQDQRSGIRLGTIHDGKIIADPVAPSPSTTRKISPP